ncbi:hypothetical protein M422DRAFT_276703 [Sphaerobolus stellatus SS14]|uniref:Uncharacterized protein n=1 Tax=Sphaerobolus stellatus (strain SS14) TaxID=990650 RepID=A0A0C9UBA7_SPHS4|nr:hypothetical protein M422DRAFT_276703 [Sphaerobolus stellatus SS14]
MRKSHVYRKWIRLHGPQGEIVREKAVVDGGAMRNVADKKVWEKKKHRLGPLQQSTVVLKVADNHPIRSEGCWSGEVEVAGVKTKTDFEIIDTNGAFDLLLGKPWLRDVKAVHDYARDTIQIQDETATTTITNDDTHMTPKDDSEGWQHVKKSVSTTRAITMTQQPKTHQNN